MRPENPTRTPYEAALSAAILRRFRIVTVFGALLMMAFSGLDRAVYPELFWPFLKLRVGSSSVLLLMYALGFAARFQKLRPLLWITNAALLAPGFAIIAMIALSEGVASGYYQGINLVLLAMFTINSYVAWHNLGVGLALLVAYCVAIFLNPVTVTAALLLPPLFFMGSTLAFVVIMTRLFSVQHQREYEKNEALVASSVRLEQALEKLRTVEKLKDSFVANVSHELRTPLSLILGPVRKLLEAGTVPESQKNDLIVIERNARVLIKQVNDLLDISRLDAGKMEMHWQRADAGELLRYVCSHFEILARERKIELSVQAEPHCVVELDVSKIERTLFNLVSNALKFTPERGAVRCAVAKDSENRVVFTVQDTGPGIPESLRAAVFDRFRQLEIGDTRRYGGTGLGLAIAKEFVELHAGEILISSSSDGGALFTVRLPAKAPGGVTVLRKHEALSHAELAPEPLPLSDEPVAGRAAVSGPTILVVEDSPEMVAFIVDALSGTACVLSARDGFEGWQLVQRKKPDLVITDMMMPRMSGEQLVQLMKETAETAHIPALVLTAKADDELRVRLLGRGVQDYLYKPFSRAELKARASNLLMMKRVRELLERELEEKSENLCVLAEALAENKRKLQSALEKTEFQGKAKDEFMMNVSHELRTPLAAILGWAEVLSHAHTDATQVEAATKSIIRNAHLQLRLIDDMLDMSRIILGNLSVEKKNISMQSVLHSAVDSVRTSAAKKGIDLVIETTEETTATRGDFDRLHQVLTNLLDNAIKFTPMSGTIRVTLAVSEKIEVRIQDSGEGIAPEFMPYLFERLKQADTSMTRRHGGLGLGLAICRQIVELHSGTIEAHSRGKGQGSTFVVRLPRSEIVAARGRSKAAPEAFSNI